MPKRTCISNWPERRLLALVFGREPRGFNMVGRYPVHCVGWTQGLAWTFRYQSILAFIRTRVFYDFACTSPNAPLFTLELENMNSAFTNSFCRNVTSKLFTRTRKTTLTTTVEKNEYTPFANDKNTATLNVRNGLSKRDKNFACLPHQVPLAATRLGETARNAAHTDTAHSTVNAWRHKEATTQSSSTACRPKNETTKTWTGPLELCSKETKRVQNRGC